MFCVDCGKKLLDYVKFCEYCGHKVDIEIDIEEKNHHLWARFFARTTDYLIIFLVSIMITNYVFHSLLKMILEKSLGFLFIIIIMVSWVFIESILLYTTGTTPGKWLFNIHIYKKNGNKIGLIQAMNRSTLVWLDGFAMGIPLISFATLLRSYYSIDKNKVAPWDKDKDIMIKHENMGFTRSFLNFLFLGSIVIGSIVIGYIVIGL